MWEKERSSAGATGERASLARLARGKQPGAWASGRDSLSRRQTDPAWWEAVERASNGSVPGIPAGDMTSQVAR